MLNFYTYNGLFGVKLYIVAYIIGLCIYHIM